ncbi:hypothetical protein SAMN04488117_101828 [Celeribacter baekdonensis]|uniref:Uncharacterized protein n=1 Tax=Celeribacter baekdonensis TaxID=875171 RepID=A0A1G7H2A3_9RHOB|nr:hypothetical protein SAMN04488117_101828 [Celeribacter baekdonensis]
MGLKSCMLGAEFLIVTMAAGRTEIQTVQRFGKVTKLSYGPARNHGPQCLGSSQSCMVAFGGAWFV